MTPLQQAAQQVIEQWDAPLWKNTISTAHFIGELRKALEAEQAQAVEPVGYLNLASVKLPGEKHLACEFSYERDNNAAAAIPLYIHPAPPAQAVEPVATVQCVRGVTFGYLDVMQPVGTKLYLHPVQTPAEPTVKQSLMVHASAEDYMRYKYGAYRWHFAWRELEEAYSQGRYDELQAQGPIPWPDDAPEEVRYKRGYAVALSDAEEAIDDECRERVVTASDCIEIIRNLGAETEATE